MTKKTISKVIIYYEDGTYEEVKASFYPLQDKQDKSPVAPHPIDFRPDWQKVREWQEPAIPRPTWTAPNTNPFPGFRIGDVYCVTSSRDPEMNHYMFTSTGNNTPIDKYTITSTGNGNVDISK